MIHYDQRGRVALVTIDRPERRNALDQDSLAGLEGALGRATEAASRALVLTGAGGHFCSGADLSGVEDTEFVQALNRVLAGLRDAPFPTIAAVEGFALGAGTQLAVACDLRVATPDARFGVPAAKLGLMVDWWTVQRAASMCGQGAARAMFLTTEQLAGERAFGLGLVQRLGGLDDALGWAGEIAALAPLTVQGLKLGLNLTEPVSPAPDAYVDAFRRAWSSEDLQEGLAAFRERRKPEFRGR
ncbi:enoyl-CoA hydratase [Rhabdothermincola sediminis]|uniref:enoyl-CoA hydratase n=1 Tax=Rhabdothermincola sediminis TaxID=2751370 RepID=UPI001AA0619D|nr:enoyl-CoA hydratase [Rhabdothermincola sediminis]